MMRSSPPPSAFRRICLIAAIALSAMPSAGTTGGNLPLATGSKANQDIAAGYRFSAENLRYVKGLDQAALTGERRIGIGGELSLRLIRPIDSTGKTPDMLAKVIAGKLEKGGYVLSPRVSIELITHGPFTILGAIRKPQEYPNASDLTLAQPVPRQAAKHCGARSALLTARRLVPPWGNLVQRKTS